jgi:hypothetical protein
MKRSNRLLGVAAAAIAVLVMIVPASAMATAEEEYVALRSGHMGRFQWSAGIEAPEGANERKAGDVCLYISVLEPTASGGEGQLAANCGAPPTKHPTTEFESGGSYEGRLKSVLALLFPSDVRSIMLKLRGSPAQTIQTVQVSDTALPSGPRVPLAFAAKGIVGRICIERVTGISAAGKVVSTLGRQRCV